MRRINLLSILALMLFCALGAKAEIHTVTWTDFSGEGAIYNSGECVSYSGDRIGGDLSDGRFYVNLSNDDYYIDGPVEVEDIFFESDEFNLNIGESVRLNATIIPENATYKDLTFYIIVKELVLQK